jgi:uncharacterized protein
MAQLWSLRSGAALLAVLGACIAASPAAAQVRLDSDTGTATVRVMSWRDIPFRTVVRQEHDFSCGSAALATLLTYHYGRKTSEADTFQAMYAKGDQAKIRKVGFSMLDMKRYLADRGLRSSGYKLTLEEVAQSHAPVIALINVGAYRHFVVIKGVDHDKVLIGDPALGLKITTRAIFEKMWNGIALALDTPAQGAPPPRFNEASEWSPWAASPLRQMAALSNDTMSTVTSNQFILYQITPSVIADNRPGD